MKSNVSQIVRRHADARRALAAAVLAAAICAVCPPWARAELPLMDEVEQAVLAADAGAGSLQDNWAPVVQRLENVDEHTPNPVLRMIKGHACLAVNRNNESVCLFLSVQAPEDKQRCLRWAEGFAVRHPDAPIAHYFHADALARLERWDDAVARFSTAIEKAPNQRHALAFNGRGVMYAQANQFDHALCDFDDAARLAPSLGDPEANRGDVYIQMRSGARGAYQAFDRAVGNSPDFAVALMGRACMRVVLKGSPVGNSENYRKESRRDFERAIANSGCLRGEVEQNIKAAAFYMGPDEAPLDLLADTSFGTEFRRLMTAEQQFRANPTDQTARNFVGELTRFDQVDARISGRTMAGLGMSSGWRDQATQERALTMLRRQSANLADLGPLHRQINNAPTTVGESMSASVLGSGSGASYTESRPNVPDFLNQQRRSQFDTTQRMIQTLERNLDSRSGPQAGGNYVPRFPEQSYGGVTANLEHMNTESGDWPFRSIHGLCYPAKH